jgi:uncharacterized integral membrane protein
MYRFWHIMDKIMFIVDSDNAVLVDLLAWSCFNVAMLLASLGGILMGFVAHVDQLSL